MNEELDLLIENFDQLSLENIDEYQVLMNTGGGPTPAETSNQKIDPNESYVPIFNKPYKQFYDKIINRQPPKGNKYKDRFELNDNYDKPINHGGTKLDLDCKMDTKKALLTWADSMILFFLYNKDDTWENTDR